MGIRTQIKTPTEHNTGDDKGFDVEVVVDNGGGGGQSFDANVYFQFSDKLFRLEEGTAEDRFPSPSGCESTTLTDPANTCQLMWSDVTIEWQDAAGNATSTSFIIKLRYKAGVTVAKSTVTAWAALLDGTTEKVISEPATKELELSKATT